MKKVIKWCKYTLQSLYYIFKDPNSISDTKREFILMECYRKMYRKATPKADFDELMATSPRHMGSIEIPFRDYTLSEKKSDKIIDNISKKYRLNEYNIRRLKFSANLGCSPCFEKK